MHRLFVAIRPPEHILDILVDSMDDSPELRWVSDENLHLTLRFIGEVDRPLAEDVAAALERIDFPAFSLRIGRVGRFDRRNGGALWASVEPRQHVAELGAKVDRACVFAGLEPERRAFHPHITLARYGRSSWEIPESFERRNAGLSSNPFEVDRFILFESHLTRHAAHYEAVAEYPLTL